VLDVDALGEVLEGGVGFGGVARWGGRGVSVRGMGKRGGGMYGLWVGGWLRGRGGWS